MPTITYDKKDLLNLIGRKLTDKQLEEVVNSIKPSVEKITEKEITIEHTADRPDLFGVEGLARVIKKYLNIKPGLEKYSLRKPKLTIKVNSVPVRPFIASAIVRNVKLTDEFIKSLMNIQEVLHETFGRKRRKVAIGIHDFDEIFPPLSYVGITREAKMIPLEFSEEMSLKEVLQKVSKGKEYGSIISSAKLWPVYVDKKGIFSFPPIINSDRTKVTEKTKNLFIELTGTDKQAVSQTLNIIVTNLAERKCRIEAVRLKYEKRSEITPNLNESVVEIDQDYANKWVGLELTGKEMIKLLKKMGYDAIETKNKKLEVIVPAYRTDILHAVDVIEDIAIAYGYDNLIPELPNIATIGQSHPLEKLCSKIRQTMIGFGFQEVMRPVLTNPKEQFEKMNQMKRKIIEMENPVSEEYTCLRISLLPSLMKILSLNKHVDYPQNIFEIGDVVFPDKKEETKSKTVRKLAGILCHSKAGFAEVKSVVDSLLKNFELGYTLKQSENNSFIPGRAAEIFVEKKSIGIFGEISPQVLENWEIEMPVAAFEIDLEEI